MNYNNIKTINVNRNPTSGSSPQPSNDDKPPSDNKPPPSDDEDDNSDNDSVPEGGSLIDSDNDNDNDLSDNDSDNNLSDNESSMYGGSSSNESSSTVAKLSQDPLFFVLTKFFMTEDENIATILNRLVNNNKEELREINSTLKKINQSLIEITKHVSKN